MACFFGLVFDWWFLVKLYHSQIDQLIDLWLYTINKCINQLTPALADWHALSLSLLYNMYINLHIILQNSTYLWKNISYKVIWQLYNIKDSSYTTEPITIFPVRDRTCPDLVAIGDIGEAFAGAAGEFAMDIHHEIIAPMYPLVN